jgi:NAD(P)-dependent dehydrogenase (short-subunit alcohol dehydrogenase family)
MLENKTIVIVGGSSGIGYALAQKALNAGAYVIIAARSIERLNLAAKRLGDRVKTEVVDASDNQSVTDFFERIGTFDHLAITIKPQLPADRFLDSDVVTVVAAFNDKFWGQYRLAKQGAKFVRENGSITFTSGIASRRAYLGYSAMSAINAATEALANAIAMELAPIRVNTVCPGFVDSEPSNPSRSQHVKTLSPTLPLDRIGFAGEIADAYMYLFGNTYSTGTVIVVDGGAIC